MASFAVRMASWTGCRRRPIQELNDDLVAFFQGVDQGFIGYPTASGMIPYWLGVAQNLAASKEERAIAQAVNTLHPFILSNREEKLVWENTELLETMQ